MSVKVLGISASPRVKGSSDLLLREALAGAKLAAAQVEYLRLCDLSIAACCECNACRETGTCRVEDDFQKILQKLLEADRLIFATPIFFMTVCAQAKLFIDRCQCLWARKYVLKKSLIDDTGRDRRAMVIAVGGSKSKKMFDSVRLTMKYFLDVLDMHYTANLFVNKIEHPGQIKQHPTALKEAFRLGREMASSAGGLPGKTVEVKLT